MLKARRGGGRVCVEVVGRQVVGNLPGAVWSCSSDVQGVVDEHRGSCQSGID